MKIKKIFNPLFRVLAMLIIIISCSENEKNLSLPSHSIFEVSHQNLENTVQINQEISFADLSTGVKERTWSLDEGVLATVFKLDKNVPDILDLRAILANRDNLTPEEIAIVEAKLKLGDQTILPTYKDPILKLSFPEPGTYNINLNQVFEENAFVAAEIEPRDTNVIDTLITITVSERVQFSNFTVSELDKSGNPGTPFSLVRLENGDVEQPATVTAGKIVRLGFSITGSPDEVNVTSGTAKVVPNSLVINADATGTIDIKFSKVGTYNLEFKATRSSPTANVNLTINNGIEVIPSTEPVTLDNTIVNGDGGLTLTFSREMDDTTLIPSDFSVDIKDKNGASVAVTVDAVTLDSQDLSLLTLTLAGDKAYDDDIVTVSYTKGAFSTSDGVLLENLSGVNALVGQNPNLLGKNAGTFEDPLGVYWNWVDNQIIPLVEIVDPPTPANTTSVSPSGKVVSLSVNKNAAGPKKNGANCQSVRSIDGVEVGKSYRIKFKRYVTNTPGRTGAAGGLVFRFVPNAGGGNGDRFFALTPGNADSIDRWIEAEHIFTADKASYVDAKLKLVTAWAAYADILIDDLLFQEYNLRP